MPQLTWTLTLLFSIAMPFKPSVLITKKADLQVIVAKATIKLPVHMSKRPCLHVRSGVRRGKEPPSNPHAIRVELQSLEQRETQ